MARVTDANLFFAGGEPKPTGEITSTEMMKALNWYSQNKDSKDSLKYANDYFKKKLKIDASAALKVVSPTFGFVCRLVTNGGILCEKDKAWFDNEIDKITKSLKKKKSEKVEVVEKTNVVSIQDRIRDKASECIGELEGLIDELILSSFDSNVSPYALMNRMNMKDAQTKYIVEWAKKKRVEFDEVLNTKDKELKDAYSFTKPQMKKLVAFCDQVILDCQKISGDSVKTRKPRKRKVKSPDELVAKVNYCKEFAELKLVSVKPTEIIGAAQLWVYNTKNRKLGCYHAEDAGGLSVKGSTILNFSESKSVHKTLRKPAEILPEVLKGGKVFLRNVISNIRAVESGLTGRLNGDIILLRTIK